MSDITATTAPTAIPDIGPAVRPFVLLAICTGEAVGLTVAAVVIVVKALLVVFVFVLLLVVIVVELQWVYVLLAFACWSSCIVSRVYML